MMETPDEFVDMLLRLLAAALTGTIIGWERESKDKPAGLRTHMMVSLGAAVFAIVGLEIMESAIHSEHKVQFDFLRVVQGIIGGVGFLGAGAIIHAGGTVRGITTAASIWLTAAIGLSCGLGFYLIALTAGVLGIVVLFGFHIVERKLFPDNGEKPIDHER